MNKVIFDGRLTRDPEVRGTPSGKTVATLSVAVNSGTREKPEVYYAEVVVWEKQAEMCRQYLGKGSRVLIEGRLIAQEWQDRQSGQKRNKTAIVAQSVQFLDKKPDEQQTAPKSGYNANVRRDARPPQVEQQYAPPVADDIQNEKVEDDIPF